MYSQCPDCQTRFRVTAGVLRAAHGTVRCGRCGSAFDALERLTDAMPPAPRDLPPVPLLVAARDEASPESAAAAEYHFSAEDLERVFVDAGRWREAFPPSDDMPEPADLERESPVVVVDEDAPIEDITLEGEPIRIDEPPAEPRREDDLDSTDELEILRNVTHSAYPEDVEDEAQQEIDALVRQLAGEPAPLDARTAAEPAAASLEPPPTATPAEEEEIPLPARRWRAADASDEAQPARSGSFLRTLAWTFGSVLLALVLAAQLAHHYRQDLVRNPTLGPPLRTVYERLGLALLPNWDLAALELRQWGNDADAAAQGRMVVRASLTNRASFAQPHPVLRLELEDRFGNTVATRDFEPADYLKSPSQAERLIAPGTSGEAELVLVDTGPEAVGYRLDVCLRESATLLRCARGPG